MKTKTKKSLIGLISILIFAGLVFFLWRGLSATPEATDSPLIGKALPAFHLDNLMDKAHPFTEKDLKGHVALLNVWASWCSACEMEHGMMMELKNKYAYPIYGVNYKDDPVQAMSYLTAMGNPYTMVGSDVEGSLTMDLGVYGTPETFIIDKKGTIVYRHMGVITQDVWDEEMLPILKGLE